MVRFKAPKMEHLSDTKQVVLSDTLSVNDSEQVVNDLIQQLEAHVVNESETSNGVKTWALNYGGASVDLVYEANQKRLVIKPLSTHTSCTLLDLYELFAIQSAENGW